MGKKLSQEDFLKRVKENNKNSIDLSKFFYKGEIPDIYKPYTYYDKIELLEQIKKPME